MAGHPNATLVKRAFQAFATRDTATLREVWPDDYVYHYPGRNQLSGDYQGADAVLGFFGRVAELSNGTFRAAPFAVLADDEYVATLVSATAERDGRKLEGVVQVFVARVSDGKIAETWTYQYDPAVDEFWS